MELGVRVQEEVEGDGVGPAARGVGREPIQDLVAHGRRTLEDRVDVERAVLAWVGNVGLRDDFNSFRVFLAMETRQQGEQRPLVENSTSR